jgi:hypothetical protein
MHDVTAGNCWREDDGSGSRLADMDTSRAAVRRSSRRRRAGRQAHMRRDVAVMRRSGQEQRRDGATARGVSMPGQSRESSCSRKRQRRALIEMRRGGTKAGLRENVATRENAMRGGEIGPSEWNAARGMAKHQDMTRTRLSSVGEEDKKNRRIRKSGRIREKK